MAHVISFNSKKFDVRSEASNPFNPIAGQGFLLWLSSRLKTEEFSATDPEPEDWGWYIDVKAGDAAYLIGASADGESKGPCIEWVIQIHKSRSFLEIIFRRNRLTLDDPFFLYIKELIENEPDFSEIKIELEA